jgi:hypothetical protein
MSNVKNLPATFNDEREEVDLSKYPTAKALVERASEFFAEVKNLCVNNLTCSYRRLIIPGPQGKTSKST